MCDTLACFQLRSYKSELDIEEIVKHRTEQIFQVIFLQFTNVLFQFTYVRQLYSLFFSDQVCRALVMDNNKRNCSRWVDFRGVRSSFPRMLDTPVPVKTPW